MLDIQGTCTRWTASQQPLDRSRTRLDGDFLTQHYQTPESPFPHFVIISLSSAIANGFSSRHGGTEEEDDEEQVTTFIYPRRTLGRTIPRSDRSVTGEGQTATGQELCCVDVYRGWPPPTDRLRWKKRRRPRDHHCTRNLFSTINEFHVFLSGLGLVLCSHCQVHTREAHSFIVVKIIPTHGININPAPATVSSTSPLYVHATAHNRIRAERHRHKIVPLIINSTTRVHINLIKSLKNKFRGRLTGGWWCYLDSG